MDTHVKLLFFVSLFICVTNAENECSSISSVPISHLYEDLGCTPKYDSQNVKCPKEYDCSHIYKRPENTCHIKGTYISDGEEVNREIIQGRCDHASHCKCAGKAFTCIRPSDSCGEFWVPGWTKPGCYLTYEQNRCCSTGQICPPFTNITECNVNGVTYKEGSVFENPNKKCTKCICSTEFNGSFESPICQKLNCTSELLFSSEIDNYCAPLYRNSDSCCPSAWVCPNDDGTYTPSSSDSELQCKFKEKIMKLGDKYEGQDSRRGNISCECLIPPYVTCFRK